MGARASRCLSSAIDEATPLVQTSTSTQSKQSLETTTSATSRIETSTKEVSAEAAETSTAAPLSTSPISYVEAAVDIKAADDADHVLPHDIPVPDDGVSGETRMDATAANEPIMSIDATNQPAVIEAVKGAAETAAADMAMPKATDEAARTPEIAASDVVQAKSTDDAEDARVALSVKMDPAGDEEKETNVEAVAMAGGDTQKPAGREYKATAEKTKAKAASKKGNVKRKGRGEFKYQCSNIGV